MGLTKQQWENSGLLQGLKVADKDLMIEGLDATYDYLLGSSMNTIPDIVLYGRDRLSLKDFLRHEEDKTLISINELKNIFLHVGLTGTIKVDVTTLLFPMCRRVVIDKRKKFDPYVAHLQLSRYSKDFNKKEYGINLDLECEFLASAVEEYY